MNKLFTLAYPSISEQDAARLDALRQAHDPRRDVVAAHFTMVFGCSTVEEEAYLAHVTAVSQAAGPVKFSCRYAMLGADDEAERGYVFLVPDEGYSGLSRLHDELYRGVLAERLRLDIPFVPHITLGASADRAAAKRLCDELNATGLAIHGVVDALTVTTLQGHTMRDLKRIPLDG
jgi:2'-5' RNA ligase